MAILLILRQRACDFHRRADSSQGEKSSSRFAMEANAAMRMRHGPHKTFVESIGRRELTPVRHRVTSVRLALPSALFLFAVNREVTMRGWSTRFAHVSLNSHQHPVPFHHKQVLRRGRKFDFHLGRIVRFVSRHMIRASTCYPSCCATSK
jgi:hypothetical protein